MASRKVALVGSLRRATLNVAAALVVVYLSAAALRPSIVEALPENLRWFGAPGSVWTTVIAVTVLIAACATTLRFKNTQRLAGVSFTVIALLGGASALLGLCSYWRCHDADHPAFITPLMATAQRCV